MSRENARTSFSTSEMDEIRGLIQELMSANSKRQKSIRAKLHSQGLYWDEVGNRMPYTLESLDILISNGIIKITDSPADLNNEIAMQHSPQTSNNKTNTGRKNSDEHYVINLCDEVLGQHAARQHKFDFLKGDGENPRCLPVDAYYEGLKLVIANTVKKLSFSTKKILSVASLVESNERYMTKDVRKHFLNMISSL